MMSSVPEARLRRANDAPLRDDGDFVLYWMTAQRRATSNFALDRALEQADALQRPLVVLESLRVGYPHASARFHRFILDGMADNARVFADAGVRYYPYLEPTAGAGKGLLEALAARACVVVGDEYPAFFLPRMVAAAARKLDVLMEVVDSCGLLPIRVPDRDFSAAYHFRRFLQRNLGEHLLLMPRTELPESTLEPPALTAVEAEWPPVDPLEEVDLDGLDIDHEVGPTELRGGTTAALERLEAFVRNDLPRYQEDRRNADQESTSRLSPYLHFGHVSPHQVLEAVAEVEDWSPARLGAERSGARKGYWNMSEPAEAFLDELVTWREIGLVTALRVDDHDRYETLPEWARQTLADHADDERPWVYDLQTFESAETHDELWNAAQRQLVREGRIHNYLRMLWGKKILHWSESPRRALEIMLHLNDKYALDGRDANSVSGIFWVLGRYDRGWPERDVFGKIRYMTSDSTRRKMTLDGYLERFGTAVQGTLNI